MGRIRAKTRADYLRAVLAMYRTRKRKVLTSTEYLLVENHIRTVREQSGDRSLKKNIDR